MYRRLLIECSSQYDKFAIVDRDKNLKHIQIIPKKGTPRVGQIYRGRVKFYSSTMHSGIIDIGERREVFLSSAHRLIVGEELLVQILREEEKTKKAKASTDITIGGEYTVLIKGEKQVIVSKKNANDHNAQELARKLKDRLKPEFGILLRTKASLDKIDEIYNELDVLESKFDLLQQQGIGLKFDPYDLMDVAKKLWEEYEPEQIFCNEKEICKALKRLLESQEVEVMHDDLYLFDKNRVKLQDILKKEYIYHDFSLSIDYLEALCVVDVNSGYMKPGAIRENKILELNKEAFLETVRLLELLGIGGMVLIDFISMNKIGQKKLEDFIEKNLKNHYNRDRKIITHSMANSSMMQLVIEKSERDLVHTLGTACRHCQGTGLMLNEKALLDLFEVDLLPMVEQYRQRSITVNIPRFMSARRVDEVCDLLSKYSIDHRIVYSDIDRITID